MDMCTYGAGACVIGTEKNVLLVHEDGCQFPVLHFIQSNKKNRCFAMNLFLRDVECTPTQEKERMGQNGDPQEDFHGMFADEHFIEGSLCELVKGTKMEHKNEKELEFSDSWESFLSMFATDISVPHRDVYQSVEGMKNDRSNRKHDTDAQPIFSITDNTEVELITELSEKHELEISCDWDNITIEQALEQMSNLRLNDGSLQRCVSLIQKCKQHGCVATAVRAYSHICVHGLDHHGVLGSYLVAMFVRCSSMLMAEQVFRRLLFRNQYSWTHLMQGYIEEGDPELVLHLFDQMNESGVLPDTYAFLLVLRVCKVLKLVSRGQQIHTEIVLSLNADIRVSRVLVDFYVRCGLFMEANDIFNDLHGHANPVEQKNSSRSYVRHQVLEAPTISDSCKLSKMHVFALKACSSMKVLTQGHGLHDQIVKAGLEQDYYISNALIGMYAKCGHLVDAWNILSSMSTRDDISWIPLITGCIENDLCDNAWKYLEMMEKEGTPLNVFTICSYLKGCSSSQRLDIGRRLHLQIFKVGWYTDFVVCNSLISMYAKCGSLEEAHDVFDKFARQDIISWTSLISGYTDHGLYEEAEDCFTSMIAAGVRPNSFAYSSCLKACTFTANLHMGCKLHHDLVIEEFENDIVVGNALVHMYSKCGQYSDAKQIFNDLSGRDAVLWTTMISELVQDGQGVQALNMLEQMGEERLSATSHTYVIGLKACSITTAIEHGRVLHNEIIKRGFETIPLISEALVNMYGVCGKPITLPLMAS